MSKVPHYNAFISYRHHPDDIKVAEAIHKGLERFPVPRSMRKQGKRIKRIFRDREELPITSSLTDTITLALANSDYLIVICSPHVKDSYWVQREIEAFLETHTKDEILTVIAGGDPAEVIPEILTYRDVIDPTTGHYVREPVEPLGCNWTLPPRQAKKQELPRLAAVLLGCSYDDLIQRQKQYRMQKLLVGGAAALALSLGFAGYFLYSSIRIQNNLNQSLRNQSEYLTSTSAEVLQGGDRLTAIALALAGLPSEEKERPYLPEAELALSQALSMYDPTPTLKAVRTFTGNSPVEYLAVSPDESLLYVLDSQNVLTAWDTASGTQLWTTQLKFGGSPLYTDKYGNVIVLDGISKNGSGYWLYCYQPDGSLLWSADHIEDFFLMEDKSTIIATKRDGGHSLLTLSTADGTHIKPPISLAPEHSYHEFNLLSANYPAQQPYLMAKMPYSSTTYSVFALDPATQKETILPTNSRPWPALLYRTADGKSLVCATNSHGYNGLPLARRIAFDPEPATVYCFSPEGKLLWTNELTAYMTAELITWAEIPESSNYFLQFGNGLFVLDGGTGEVLSASLAPSSPKHIEVGSTEAYCVFSAGYTGTFNFEDSRLQVAPGMTSDIKQVVKNNSYFVSHWESATITQYSADVNADYDLIDDVALRESHPYARSHKSGKDLMLLETNYHLYCYDLTTDEMLWDAEWSRINQKLLGFSGDDSKFYFYIIRPEEDEVVYGVLCLDNRTLEADMLPFPLSERYPNDHVLADDHLYCVCSDEAQSKHILVDWNLVTGDYVVLDDFPAPLDVDWADYLARATIVHADNQRVLIRGADYALYEWTLTDGKCRYIAADAGKYPVVYADDSLVLLGGTNSFAVYDARRTLLQTISLPSVDAASLFAHEGIFYALCTDGKLYRFTADGTALDTITLQTDDAFFTDIVDLPYDSPITWTVTGDGDLIIDALGTGNVFSLDYEDCRAYVPGILSYHAASDSFISYYNGANHSGDLLLRYPRLSTEALMARAKDVLGSFTLTEEQKAAYGLVQTAGA